MPSGYHIGQCREKTDPCSSLQHSNPINLALTYCSNLFPKHESWLQGDWCWAHLRTSAAKPWLQVPLHCFHSYGCIFVFYLYFPTEVQFYSAGAYSLAALSLWLVRKGLINLGPGPVQEGRPQPLVGLFPCKLLCGTIQSLRTRSWPWAYRTRMVKRIKINQWETEAVPSLC